VFSAGYNDRIIADNVAILKELKENSNIEMYIGGLMGCYGNAYKATDVLTTQQAKEFHSWQANSLHYQKQWEWLSQWNKQHCLTLLVL